MPDQEIPKVLPTPIAEAVGVIGWCTVGHAPRTAGVDVAQGIGLQKGQWWRGSWTFEDNIPIAEAVLSLNSFRS